LTSLGSALYHAGVEPNVSIAPTFVTSEGMLNCVAVAAKEARPSWAERAAERAEPVEREPSAVST
jgi:hypothetical protein